MTKVLTAVDYLKGKQKKIYTSGGKIMNYNMYDDIKNIPSYEEIWNLDLEVGKTMLAEIKSRHQVKTLVKHWGISDHTIYTKLYPRFNVLTRKHISSVRNLKNSKNSPDENNNVVVLEPENNLSKIMEQQRNDIIQAAMVVKNGVETILNRLHDEEQDGLSLRIKGTFTGKQATDRIISAADKLSDTTRYKISLQIIEIYEQEE
jgi:hypothetical protein